MSEAIQDSLLSYDVLFEVLRLKSRELKEYILAHVAQDEFIDFFEDFFRKANAAVRVLRQQFQVQIELT